MLPDRFETSRLTVRNWRQDLDAPSRRKSLEAALEEILNSRVLEHLPPPLQLTVEGGISGWVSARAEESDVLLVTRAGSSELVGLLIIATDMESPGPLTLHIGYLFAQADWGQGYATEVLSGLIAALGRGKPVRLVGGVSPGNAASARVLEKVGFRRDPELSMSDVDMFVRVIH